MKHFSKHILSILGLLVFSTIGFAQTTAFNFQGRLNDGSSPANGSYDLQFKLFNAITGGSQVGATLNRPNLTLVNGVFSTTLNFGAAPFDSGNRFIEIWVKPTSLPNGYVVLGSRQQILSVPLAIRATSAVDAENATNAQNAVNSQNASNASLAQNSLALDGHALGEFARLNLANPGALIGSSLASTGSLSVTGNTLQPRAANGMVKAMIAVTSIGAIARCYNGVTGSTTPPCGFQARMSSSTGLFIITLPFQVDDRFWIATPEASATISENVTCKVTLSTTFIIAVSTYMDGSPSYQPFHLFVY